MKKLRRNTPQLVLYSTFLLIFLTLVSLYADRDTEQTLLTDAPCMGTPVPELNPGGPALSGERERGPHELKLGRSSFASVNSHPVMLRPDATASERAVACPVFVRVNADRYDLDNPVPPGRSPPLNAA